MPADEESAPAPTTAEEPRPSVWSRYAVPIALTGALLLVGVAYIALTTGTPASEQTSTEDAYPPTRTLDLDAPDTYYRWSVPFKGTQAVRDPTRIPALARYHTVVWRADWGPSDSPVVYHAPPHTEWVSGEQIEVVRAPRRWQKDAAQAAHSGHVRGMQVAAFTEEVALLAPTSTRQESSRRAARILHEFLEENPREDAPHAPQEGDPAAFPSP